MKYTAAFLLAALALAGAANAQDRTLIRYQLDNGLDVVLVPDDRVAKVLLNISYRVGAMNEPPGRSGFAHLFEHLMFAGTPTWPNIDIAYGEVGGGLNAYTYADRTTYYATGMSSILPMMLSLEADRMANQGAAITADDLDVQRDVVLNEMRQNVLDWVTGTAYEAMLTSLQPADHPYSRAVIGSIADLNAASIADVHAFFDTYYVPNNATLALVGDFDPADAKALIAATFGKVPRGADVPRVEVPAFEPARVRLAFEDRVAGPTLLFGWTIPPVGADGYGFVRIANKLIDNADYGVMRRSVIDAGLAASTRYFFDPGRLHSRFILQVNGVEGVDPVELEAVVREALSEFLGSDLTPEALERERRRVILDDRVANENLETLSNNLLITTEVLDDPGRVFVDDPALVDATPEQVMTAAQALHPDRASVALVLPGGRGSYPPVLVESSGSASPLVAAPRPAVEVPRLEPRPVELTEPPRAETTMLSNGIRVIHYPLPKAALTLLAAVSAGGTLSAPAGKEGVIELATGMAPRGAGGRSAAAFGEAIRNLGGEIEDQADDMASAITLSAPPETFGDAVALFADAVRRPAFDRREWDVQLAATLDELGLREGDATDVAARYAEAALFPRAAGQPAIDRSIASVRAVTMEDARAAFARMFMPSNVTFYSVGATPLAEIAAALEREFGDWTSDAEPLVSPPLESPTFPSSPRVFLVPEPAGAAQAAIFVGMPAPGYDDPGRAEGEVTFNVLIRDFLSRINSVIREEKGYTYGSDGALYGTVRKGSLMSLEAPVETGVVGAALDEIFKELESIVADPPRPDEVRRSVIDSYTVLAEAAETAQGLFDDLWEQLAMGSTLEERYDVRKAVTQVTLPGVQAEAARLAATGSALVVVVGDPEIAVPQLELLGYTVDVVERSL